MHLGSEILPKLLLGRSKDTSRLAYIVVCVHLYLFLVCHTLVSTAYQSLGVLPMASKYKLVGSHRECCI